MNMLQRAVVKTLTALRAYPSPQPMTWESLARELGEYGNQNLTGVSVNEYSALNYSPIWCGVATLSNDVAKLPLVLHRNLPNGGKERFKTHRLYRMLHDEPNPEMTSLKFRETMQALCLLYGNAYAEIVRDDLGRPVGMYPIVPYRVTPIREERTGLLKYRVMQPSGGQKLMQPANMIHLSSLCTDGVIGHSLVEHANASIGLGLATEQFGAAFFGNGSTFGGVIELPLVLDEKQKADYRTLVEAVHRGVDRAHKILLLAGGAKFSERGTSQSDSQFNETRQFQIQETGRWLRMPPHKLGDYEHAHFDNIELSNLDYWRGCVAGWLKMWEQELSRKLISPLEYNLQSIDFVMAGELRGDSAARSTFYKDMIGIGVFSINDVLRLEDMNPIGPEGDGHLVPLNMIPAERVNEYIDAQIKAKTAPPQLPPKPDDDEAKKTQEELEASRARVDELMAKATTAESRAIELEANRAVAELGELEANEARTLAEAEVVTQRTALAAAEQLVTERTREVEQAQAQALAAETRATTEAARAATAEQSGEAVRITADTIASELAERVAALAVAESTLQDARTALSATEVAAGEAQARIEAEASRAAAAEQATEAIRITAAATAAELASQTAAQAALEAALQETRTVLSTTEAAVQERRTAELERLTNVIGAHRALIVDAMGRMIRRETEKARRHQGTPDKLRTWAGAFYATHEETCVEAILPAVRTHLAWRHAPDEPAAVALALVREHIDQSLTQLRAVIDGSEPEEFAVALERLLSRWETDRPHAVADVVLKEEINYVRSYR